MYMQFDKILGLVQDRANLPSGEKAFRATRAVISVLKEAVSEGEINDIIDQLPEEYEPLFESGCEGPLKA
jgi:uncharacterized protein (DUF2267 family)